MAKASGVGQSLRRDLRQNYQLYLIFLPALAYFIIFHYAPMYGVQIAFRNFVPARGIWGSEWWGTYHFERFFRSYSSQSIIWNTLRISLLSLVLGLPLGVLLVAGEKNGVLPLVADAACHVDGTVAGGGAAWFYDADPDDNTIQYAESMGFTTWNGAGIVGRTMRFSMDSIRTVEGEDSRVIASGDWDLKFEMNYVDTTVDLPAGQETTWQGANVTIDAVAVSSVGVTVDYTIDRQIGDLGPSGRLSDEARAKQDAVLGLPVTVAFADGTTFDAISANTTAVKQDDGTSAVTKTATYDRIVAAGDIVSVTVGDVEIPVSAA